MPLVMVVLSGYLALMALYGMAQKNLQLWCLICCLTWQLTFFNYCVAVYFIQLFLPIAAASVCSFENFYWRHDYGWS
jgi:uncharacterized protein (DUF486 family)